MFKGQDSELFLYDVGVAVDREIEDLECRLAWDNPSSNPNLVR